MGLHTRPLVHRAQLRVDARVDPGRAGRAVQGRRQPRRQGVGGTKEENPGEALSICGHRGSSTAVRDLALREFQTQKSKRELSISQLVVLSSREVSNVKPLAIH